MMIIFMNTDVAAETVMHSDPLRKSALCAYLIVSSRGAMTWIALGFGKVGQGVKEGAGENSPVRGHKEAES